MIILFCMLISRCFRIYYWPPLIQNFIQYLLCCFINMEDQILQSQIACHTFLCLYHDATVKLANGNTVHAQLIGIVLYFFVILYIQWGDFIIFHVTFPTPSDWVPFNFIFNFKRLHINLLNILILLTLRVVLGYHSTRLKTI